MITEQFVNTCIRLVISDNKSIPPSVMSDINDVINSIEEKNIPLLFRKKYQLLLAVVQLKIDDPKIDKNMLLDSVLTTGFFKDLENYIQGLTELELSDEQVSQCIDAISKRKALISIGDSGTKIEKYLEKLKTNSFTDVNKATSEWKDIISSVHTDIINRERNKDLHNIRSLDLLNDDYEPVLHQIKQSYSGVHSISTGYDSLDCHMYGGFAPARLYMFCATSGGGKSVMLINLAKNAVDRNLSRNDTKRAMYVYVSLENLIDESLVRLYSCLSGKTVESIIDNYETERTLIPKTVKTWLNNNNANIKFLYEPANSTNCLDILSDINDLKADNPDCDLRAIYIDYLDLMRPNSGHKNVDAYRLELGQVSMDMKTMAVLLRVPVVTATQVNRTAYDPKNKMNLSNVSESMKKVDNSDWICMIQQKDIEQEKSGDSTKKTYNSDINEVELKITKSRFGHKDVTAPFRTNFSIFKFEELKKNSGIDIDQNLNELDERTKISDKITQIQNERYSDQDVIDAGGDPYMNMDGFI